MRSRVALAIMALLTWGCRGEFSYELDVESESAGTGEPSSNLLGNPSFELWNGNQAPPWTVSGATLSSWSEASEGQASAVVTAEGYASLRQVLNFPDGLPAGTCLRGGATIRWIDGSGTAPSFLFTAIYDDDSEELLGSELAWTPDGQWYESQTALIELPKTATELVLSIGDATPDPHEYGIDDAWFIIDSC